MSTTIKYCNDGTYCYFKVPYNVNFNEEIKSVVPREDRDTSEGLGWCRDEKIWKFPSIHQVAVEACITRNFDRVYWKQMNTAEDVIEG